MLLRGESFGVSKKLSGLGMEFEKSGLREPSREGLDMTLLSSGADMAENAAAPRTPCSLFQLQNGSRVSVCVRYVSVSFKETGKSTKQMERRPLTKCSILSSNFASRSQDAVSNRHKHRRRTRPAAGLLGDAVHPARLGWI